jgi:hypothetical protein
MHFCAAHRCVKSIQLEHRLSAFIWQGSGDAMNSGSQNEGPDGVWLWEEETVISAPFVRAMFITTRQPQLHTEALRSAKIPVIP